MWNRLRRPRGEFRTAAAKLPEGNAGTGLTNDKWSLPLLQVHPVTLDDIDRAIVAMVQGSDGLATRQIADFT